MNHFLERGIRYLKHRFAHGALILAYHRVSDSPLDPWSLSVSPDHFAEHLAVLRRSFHPTSLQDVGRSIRSQSNLADRSIVITFDDGYADNLHAALPLLQQFDIPATIFITSGAIGSQHDFWWDELASLLLKAHPLPGQLDIIINGCHYSWQLGGASQYSQADYSKYRSWRAGQPPPSMRQSLYLELWQLIYPLPVEAQGDVMTALRVWAGQDSNATHRTLNQNEIVELAQAEQIEIGNHTINHVPLSSLPPDLQRHEIQGSKTELEKIINQPVESFSYPFGKRHDYGPETISLVQESGISIACGNESGVVRSTADVFQLPRIHVPDCAGDEFEARVVSKFHV